MNSTAAYTVSDFCAADTETCTISPKAVYPKALYLSVYVLCKLSCHDAGNKTGADIHELRGGPVVS